MGLLDVITGKSKNEKGLQELLALLTKAEKEEQKQLEHKIEQLLKRHGRIANFKEIANFTGSVIKEITGAVTGGISNIMFGGLGELFSGSNNKNKLRKQIEYFKKETKEQLKLKQRHIISTFPVPVSKDKILELLSYINLILKNKKKDFLEDAWESKFYDIVNQAKSYFANDTIFLAEVTEYEQQQKKRKTIKVAIYIAIAVVIIAVAVLIGMRIYSNVRKYTENARIEQMLVKPMTRAITWKNVNE
jgi:hypothetical protein